MAPALAFLVFNQFSSMISVVTDIQDVMSTGSILLQCTKTYEPVDDVSDEIDKHVATIVNHVFDSGMREDEFKEILAEVICFIKSEAHFN